MKNTGMLVCTLLITATALPVSGTINEVINSENKAATYAPLDKRRYWKLPYPNYTPSGMPDFNQKLK